MKRRKSSALHLASVFLLAALAAGAQTTAFEQTCATLAARPGDDAARLQELFKLDWERTMHENPEFATEVGYRGQNDRWSDWSLEAVSRRKREAAAPVKVIQSIDRTRLSEADQLNYDLYKYNSEQS